MICLANKKDYTLLVNIWESAIKNTHDFVKAEDFEFYKSCLTTYFEHMDLYTYKNEQEQIIGFLGVSGLKIEMLFIDNLYRGKGIGKKLLEFALNELKADSLDVNEQNKQAVGFYIHLGFKIVGRSELDGEGKDYPLLHMQIQR